MAGIRRTRTILGLALAAACVLAGSGSATAATLGCADDASGVRDLDSWIPAMLDATNDYRASKGLARLQLDPTLARAARWKARDLARRDYFTHDDPANGTAPGRDPWARLAACGYTAEAYKAENIAAGQQSGRAFIQAWIDSPGHRANLEEPHMRYVGFGVASNDGSTYGRYGVQIFASRPGPATRPPATPTLVALGLALDGPAKLVCPPLAATGVGYELDSVEGSIGATRTAAGCIRVAPISGIGDVTGTVRYHARSSRSGATSPSVTLAVSVDSGRELSGGGPATGAPRALLASTSSRLVRSRCRASAAVAGWCWRLVTTGQLLAADRTALASQPVRISRRTRSGSIATARTVRTTARGTFRLTSSIRPPRTGTATWLARSVASVRLAVAGSARHGAVTRVVRVRR